MKNTLQSEKSQSFVQEYNFDLLAHELCMLHDDKNYQGDDLKERLLTYVSGMNDMSWIGYSHILSMKALDDTLLVELKHKDRNACNNQSVLQWTISKQ